MIPSNLKSNSKAFKILMKHVQRLILINLRSRLKLIKNWIRNLRKTYLTGLTLNRIRIIHLMVIRLLNIPPIILVHWLWSLINSNVINLCSYIKYFGMNRIKIRKSGSNRPLRMLKLSKMNIKMQKKKRMIRTKLFWCKRLMHLDCISSKAKFRNILIPMILKNL